MQISARELSWLLEGLDIAQAEGHEKARFGLL